MRSGHFSHKAAVHEPSQSKAARRQTSAARERLALIEGAIREIQSRPELSPEAKARGVRALERARARALRAHPDR